MNQKEKRVTQIILQNPNNFDIDSEVHSLRELCSTSNDHIVDMLFLPETNTHWRNKRAYDTYHKLLSVYRPENTTNIFETNLQT